MRFAQDSTSNSNVVRGYGPRELRVNEHVFTESVLIAAASVQTEAGLTSVLQLDAEHVARILALDPEVVLLGTGGRQEFPSAEFGARFLRAGIGFEVMDTGAACRTFNVLIGERRRVVALLIL